jgi:site-specific recombinase XerD
VCPMHISTPPKIDLEGLRTKRELFRTGCHSRNTQLAYADDFQTFSTWCEAAQRQALPASPDTLSLFVTALLDRGQKVTTAARRIRGIAWTHKSEGFESPVSVQVREILIGAKRLRLEQPRQMLPLGTDEVRRMVIALGEDGWMASRNRALILIGFASALRRSSLSFLDTQDLTFCHAGVEIRVRKEKQDQEGKGRTIAVHTGADPVTCPVKALEIWLELRGGERDGALFRSRSTKGRLGPDAIWRVVKDAVEAIGICASNYSPHSLRAGCITTAGENGVNHLVIAAHSGHRSFATLQRYFRATDPWKGNAAGSLGL